MKNKILFFVLISGLLTSCKDTKTTEEIVIPTPTEIPLTEINISECYQYVVNKDTVTMHLINNNNNISGQLSYKLYEKDSNNGIFKGYFDGDMLIADYTFKSEGTSSIRQIAFKQNGDDLIEGHGEMEEKDGKLLFKDIKTLNFSDNTIILKTIDCLE